MVTSAGWLVAAYLVVVLHDLIMVHQSALGPARPPRRLSTGFDHLGHKVVFTLFTVQYMFCISSLGIPDLSEPLTTDIFAIDLCTSYHIFLSYIYTTFLAGHLSLENDSMNRQCLFAPSFLTHSTISVSALLFLTDHSTMSFFNRSFDKVDSIPSVFNRSFYNWFQPIIS